jgi:hypothetical protein
VIDRLSDFLASAFAAPKRETVWQWAEYNVFLSSKVTETPGPYRSDWCPYVREPQEAFTDPDVETIVFCWASRTSKTETMANCIRYSISADPQSCLIVMPSEPLARSYSETRLQPSIDSSPVLAAEKPENTEQYKLMEMHFKRCLVFLTGANSPATLKGRGVAILALDEIDTWPPARAKETGALQQVLERTKERVFKKHLIASTPTIENGQIWQEYLVGDQRKYFVPCPHCGHMQVLTLRSADGEYRVVWDETAKNVDGTWDVIKVEKSARYICEKCKGEIRDHHKTKMLANGEWRATAQAREPHRRSYHMSSLYPVNISFGRVAVQFLRSKDSAEELQRFVNSWLAEPFYMGGNKADFEAAITQHVNDTPAEGVPAGHIALCTVDVQMSDVRFVIRAHKPNRDSIRLDYGSLPGLEEAHATAKRWGCALVFVDRRFRGQQVLEFCATHPGWVSTLGAAGLMTPFRWADTPIEGGLHKGMTVKELKVRPNDHKEQLYARIKKQAGAPNWEIRGAVGEDYKREMSGESRMVRRGPRGTTIVDWVKHSANNYFDCESNQIAAFDAVKSFIFDKVAERPPDPAPQQEPRGEFGRDELEQVRREREQATEGRDGLSMREKVW